jgi:glycosyltransferase involved in cell wall biosynthesis
MPMKITAQLRIRNEARWLREVLVSIQPLTRDIVVFDDNSTDASPEIAKEMGATVIYSPYAANDTNEARDKDWLFAAVRERKPQYILSIDGDEVLPAGAAEIIRATLNPEIALYCFRIKYLWNDRQHYRVDGVYNHQQQWRMFSLINQKPDLRFVGNGAGGNFHCGNAPKGIRGGGCMVDADILHLGYMHAEDRIRKFGWYNRIDPNNTREDKYRHMVIGDLYPAESKFAHGGPLILAELPEGKWPTIASA